MQVGGIDRREIDSHVRDSLKVASADAQDA
jgi:hypothetical protein